MTLTHAPFQKVTVKTAEGHPIFGKPEPVTIQHKDGTEVQCRTVLNDVQLGAHSSTQTRHFLLYLEDKNETTATYAATSSLLKTVTYMLANGASPLPPGLQHSIRHCLFYVFHLPKRIADDMLKKWLSPPCDSTGRGK